MMAGLKCRSVPYIVREYNGMEMAGLDGEKQARNTLNEIKKMGEMGKMEENTDLEGKMGYMKCKFKT